MIFLTWIPESDEIDDLRHFAVMHAMSLGVKLDKVKSTGLALTQIGLALDLAVWLMELSATSLSLS